MKKDTKAVTDTFSGCFGRRRILRLNLSGGYVIGLDRICPIAAVACLDDGLEFDLVEARSGVRFLSRERTTRRRIRTPDPCREEIIPALGREIDEVLRKDPAADWVMVCPHGSRTLEDFAHERGRPAVSPPIGLYEWLYRKENFFSGLAKLGLPRLPGQWLSLKDARFSEFRKSLGLPFVLQESLAQSGAGTHIIRGEADLNIVRSSLPDAPVWAVPYAGKLSLNINAMAMGNGVIAGYPSVQLVGLSMVGARPLFGYCGNDYTCTAKLPQEMVTMAQDQAQRVGGWLSSLGFRGIFGLDFVADRDAGRLFAVDLNPRWQGSTSLETQAMLRAGRIPLAAAELAYVTGSLDESEILRLRDDFMAPIVGSQIYLYYTGTDEVIIENAVRPGVYASEGGMKFRRAGLELSDCDAEDEILLCGGIMRPGTRLVKGARPARLVSLRAVLDSETLEPLPWVRKAVADAYELFGLTPP